VKDWRSEFRGNWCRSDGLSVSSQFAEACAGGLEERWRRGSKQTSQTEADDQFCPSHRAEPPGLPLFHFP